MPKGRPINADSVQSKEQLSYEMRQKKLLLFRQQFEKEAQERLNSLEAKMENMLASVDKIFMVELMKMPPSLQNTRIADLINKQGNSASDVSIVMKSESPEISHPIKGLTNKKGKSICSSSVSSSLRSSSRAPRNAKGTKKTRGLASNNSAENLRASSATVKRTQSCVVNRNDQTMSTRKNSKFRSVVSAGDLHCSTSGSSAHITVTTAQGQMVSFSEENKDAIDWNLLDDVARCQIQKLSNLIDYLSQHNPCKR